MLAASAEQLGASTVGDEEGKRYDPAVEFVAMVVAAVAGVGGVSVGIAWLNDRRHALNNRQLSAVDPKRTLEARLANGDIDEGEFVRRMHLLIYGPPLELEPRRDG